MCDRGNSQGECDFKQIVPACSYDTLPSAWSDRLRVETDHVGWLLHQDTMMRGTLTSTAGDWDT